MRWQNAITKQQVSHLRKYQDALTLKEFWKNRDHQKRMEARFKRHGHPSTACWDCTLIEAKLKAAGYEPQKGESK